MVDEKVSLEKGVSDLFVVLTSEVIPSYLERDYKEIYDLEDDVVSFECMADDVARVWRLVEWHEKLAEIDTSLWKFLETDNPNDLELKFKESAWLLRLKSRIEVELMLRRLRDEEVEDKHFENGDKKLLLGFCDYLLESIPSVDFLNKDNEGRLELINDFLVEWWKKNE